MSTIVQSIFDAVTSTAQTAVGVAYKPLRKVFDPSQNDFRSIEKGFGVRHGESTSADGVTRVYTIDQRFEVVLVRRFVDRDDDAAIQDSINELYDKADEILKAAFLTKLGLSAIILIVNEPAISTPEVLDNGAVSIIVSFNVKYRQAIA